MADEVPGDVRRQGIVLAAQLLHVALAKHPLATRIRLPDGFLRVELRHAHQLHLRRQVAADCCYVILDGHDVA